MNENHFNNLRTLARERRDKAIAEIQAEYNANILAIAKLEQDLCGKVSTRYKSISAAIESVIPSDRSFTTEDVMTSLEAMDSSRAWRKRSVDCYLSRLRDRGLLKRLAKANGRERAIYARTDFGAEGDSRTIGDYLAQVLTQPMTTTEVTLAILEAGFKSRMTRQHLRNYVYNQLKERGYKKSGERWTGHP